MNRVLLILLCLAAWFPLSATAVEITLHDRAEVRQRQVKLGDLGHIEATPDVGQRLAAQVITTAPPPGESKTITVQAIARAVKHLPQAETIRWLGAGKVVVHRQGIIIDHERLKSILASYLAANTDKLPKADIRFHALRLPPPFTLPTGRLEYEVTPSRKEILGSSSFSILFRVNGKIVRSCTIRGRVEAIAEVAAAAVPLQRGTIIRPDQIRMRREDLSRLRQPFLRADQVVGMQVKRTIGAGRVIEHRHLQPPPVIRKGEPVKILAARGGLRLSTMGIASMDGRPGQMIRVKNISSNKLIFCRVDGPGMVSVEF